LVRETLLRPETERGIRQFFAGLSIKTITLGANTCINNRNPVTDVRVLCTGESCAEFTVSFKLQTACADICQFLEKIEAEREVRVVFTQAALELETQNREALLDRFFRTIDRRIGEAKKEQEIQSIRYLGNTFELNKKTVFKVISDDGEGHLGIEILGNPLPQDLKLSSHGLLDGLYSGSIRQLDG
jgi:hypothetical protein